MARKVHVTNDVAKDDKSLRTAVIVTLIAGLTLVLLSTAVFSLAATTRSLSTDAENLHTADESLRAATTARAQLALGLHGSRVDSRIGSDSSSSVSASVNEAELALGGFEQSIALLDDTDLVEPAQAFLNAARASVESIRVTSSESDQNAADAALNDSYSTLIEQLTGERERLLGSVAEADRRMGTLGNLASFVVAFLLPTSAISIYRQLARRPRRQVELEHELAVERRATRDRSDAFRLGLAQFDEQVESGDTRSLVAEARRLSAATSLLYGQFTYDVARVPLGETLATFSEAAPEHLICESTAEEVSVLIDQEALALAIDTLVESASARGATRVHLAGRATPAAGRIDVLSDAEPLGPQLITEAFLKPTELTAATDQQLRGLILARTLLEGMGARIEHVASNGHEKFEITVPRAVRAAVAAPTTPAPTPA